MPLVHGPHERRRRSGHAHRSRHRVHGRVVEEWRRINGTRQDLEQLMHGQRLRVCSCPAWLSAPKRSAKTAGSTREKVAIASVSAVPSAPGAATAPRARPRFRQQHPPVDRPHTWAEGPPRKPEAPRACRPRETARTSRRRKRPRRRGPAPATPRCADGRERSVSGAAQAKDNVRGRPKRSKDAQPRRPPRLAPAIP